MQKIRYLRLFQTQKAPRFEKPAQRAIVFKPVVKKNHKNAQQKVNSPMPHVPEHNSELERESHNSEQCRIDFSITRNTVGIHDLLKWAGEVVQLEKCGRSESLLGGIGQFGQLVVAAWLWLTLRIQSSADVLDSLHIFTGHPENAFVDVTVEFADFAEAEFVHFLVQDFVAQTQ